MVLLAVCDAHYRYVSCFLLHRTQYLCINGHSLYHYRFTLIDLGDVGRHSDGEVLAHSNFGQALEDNSLSFPAPHPLPGTTQLEVPYVIVGDEAYATAISREKLNWCVWFSD